MQWFEGMPDLDRMIEETVNIKHEYTGRATNFYKIFFRKG
jgi:hypothetical protein